MKLYIPDQSYKTVFDIDYDMLKNKGITTLFFDLDNTLIPYDVPELTNEIIKLFTTLKNHFKVMVITNNNHKRTKLAVKELVPFLANAKKPFKCKLKKALKKAKSTPSETALIGDQVMTDVKASRKLNLTSILVSPIDQKSEGWPTKFNRKRELRYRNKLRKKYPNIDEERFENFYVKY